MVNTLARNYVWECDYGVRKPLIPILKTLLDEQDTTSLQMVNILINDNIYNLELFIVLSYDKPIQGHIDNMMELFKSVGVRYRPDITHDELFIEMGNRRFNSMTLLSSEVVDLQFNLFQFKEKAEVAKMVSMKPLGNKMPVFISHTSINKPEIEDLIPFLNAANLPIWYDDVSIDYGDSIVKKVQEGIKDSGAVIFWITKEFLESNWCQIEMESFLNRLAGKADILILPIVSDEVDNEDLPLFLLNKKYLKVKKEDTLEVIAKNVIPTLKRYREKI